MTLPSDPSYPIANLKSLLSQRAGIDLSPVELAEILWLALQRGGGVVEAQQQAQRSPEPSPEENIPDQSQPSLPEQSTKGQSESSASVVTQPPQPTGSSQAEGTAQPAGTALPVNIPEAVALRNRQQIARSLRPLMRKVPSKLRRSLDEEATAIASAEAQTWHPVVQPEPERWLELAIVVEVTNLLDVWQDTIAEFQQLMERHGAFRNVRTWQLKPNEAGEPQLFLQTAAGLKSNARSPRELLDAGGRRLILLLSDCTSKAWRLGKIPKLLQRWSQENPVTIVQLLPERYWDRSALGLGYPVALRSRLPGALSRDWLIEGLSPRNRRRLPEGLKFPVVTIQPEALGEWARAISAMGEQQTVGIVLGSQVLQANDPVSTSAPPLTAKQLVRQFRATASEQAQELADRMAVLPVNWSVIRLIQKNWVPQTAAPWQQTGALSLAEIFLSGLLCPLPMESEPAKNSKCKQQYDFVEGVRDILLGAIPISEAQEVGEEIAEAVFKQLPEDVQQRVSADIERRFGESLSYFEAFLIPDLPWGEEATAEVLPFARVTGQVLRRWGGDYAALAEELERIPPVPPPPVRREFPPQQTFFDHADEEESDYIDKAFNEHLDYFESEICKTFIQQEHEFQLNRHPRALWQVDEVTLVEEGVFVEVVDYHQTAFSDAEYGYKLRTLISEAYSSFELSLRIIFSIEVKYIGAELSYSDLGEDNPTLGQPPFRERFPNQVVQATAAINLVFSETNEVEPELVELRIQEPILIDLNQQPDAPVSPSLQTFEFDVAEIAFEELSAPRLALEPFAFEMATIAITPGQTTIATSDLLSLFQAIDQAVYAQTGKPLGDVERGIFTGSWNGMSYSAMAADLGCSRSHISSKAAGFWRSLSQLTGKQVTKTTLRQVVTEWATDGILGAVVISRTVGEGQQFVEDLGNSVLLEMVQIPSGSFVMGSPKSEERSNDSERPQHQVTVPAFFMGKYAITQAQWRAVAALPPKNRQLESDPSRFKGDNRPVEQVSWLDAVEFCDRLSQFTGRPYRLPSEAEWEYACRANPVFRAGLSRVGDAVGNGTATPFHFGETITPELANYDGNYTYGSGPKGEYRQQTTNVGSFPANAFGLYDMHGNVLEWCQDHWHNSYEGAPSDGSTWINPEASEDAPRLLRGGSWRYNPRYCRSARRNNDYADNRNHYFGFRVSCSA